MPKVRFCCYRETRSRYRGHEQLIFGMFVTRMCQFQVQRSTRAYLTIFLLSGETLLLNARHVQNVRVGKSVLEGRELLLRDSALGHVFHHVIGHAKARRAHVAKFNVVQSEQPAYVPRKRFRVLLVTRRWPEQGLRNFECN